MTSRRFYPVCSLALIALAWVRLTAAESAPTASDLLRGAIDLHCHSAPDVVARSVDDLQLARLARESGLRAVVIKNHYAPTAARAQIAMLAVGGIEVFGGIALNRAVGGINAEAVRRMAETDGRRGKIVWLPTFDAENAVRTAGEKRPFVPAVVNGKLVPELAEVLSVMAQHELVLATGHSSAEESLLLIAAAHAAGVKQVIVTHALFGPLKITPEQLRVMAGLGAWIELAWLMHHPPAPGPGIPAALARPMVPLERCVETIRALGARHIVLASDFGQQANPPPPEGLRAFIAALLTAGISPAEIDLMVRRNPAEVLGLGL